MNDDLIKRRDAIEAIECVDWYHQNRNKDMVSGANSDEHQAWYKAQDIYKALEAVPSADRPSNPHDITYINALKNRIKELEADRPQGEWIIKPKGFGVETKICSVCGVEKNNMSNFCPNCGADMRGADDE